MPRLSIILLFVLLSGCPSRTHAPPDASAAVTPAAVALSPTHVCFGAGGSAVEVDRATSCASLGGSETAPMEVRAGPAVRRDGGTP